MLEKHDIELLQKMFEHSEKRMETVIDQRVSSSEKHMETVIDQRVAASEKRMETVIDQRIAESEKRMVALIHKEVSESENIILEEVDRLHEIVDHKIDALRDNVEKLEQYYRITKLENDNMSILLKFMEDIQHRLTALEKKTA